MLFCNRWPRLKIRVIWNSFEWLPANFRCFMDFFNHLIHRLNIHPPLPCRSPSIWGLQGVCVVLTQPIRNARFRFLSSWFLTLLHSLFCSRNYGAPSIFNNSLRSSVSILIEFLAGTHSGFSGDTRIICLGLSVTSCRERRGRRYESLRIPAMNFHGAPRAGRSKKVPTNLFQKKKNAHKPA